MKKIMVIAFAALLLVGCGQKGTATTCTLDNETYVITSNKDKKPISMTYTEKIEVAKLGLTDEKVKENVEENMKEINKTPGVKFSYTLKDGVLEGKFDIDFATVDMKSPYLGTIVRMFGDSFTSKSLEQLVQYATNFNFECK